MKLKEIVKKLEAGNEILKLIEKRDIELKIYADNFLIRGVNWKEIYKQLKEYYCKEVLDKLLKHEFITNEEKIFIDWERCNFTYSSEIKIEFYLVEK